MENAHLGHGQAGRSRIEYRQCDVLTSTWVSEFRLRSLIYKPDVGTIYWEDEADEGEGQKLQKRLQSSEQLRTMRNADSNHSGHGFAQYLETWISTSSHWSYSGCKIAFGRDAILKEASLLKSMDPLNFG